MNLRVLDLTGRPDEMEPKPGEAVEASLVGG